MPDAPRPDEAASLYGHLAEPAPEGSPGGDTIFTATKETIDRDQEEDDTIRLLLGDR